MGEIAAMTPPVAMPGRQRLDRLLADPTGFASFVRLVRGINRRHLGALPFDEHLQETTRRALSSADHFTGTSDEQLLGWLRVIARRVVIDTIRSKRPSQPLPFDLVETESPSTGSAESAEEAARVMAVLDRLPPADRALLLARFRDGLKPRQIARITGLSGAAVRQRLSRLLRAIRIELAT